MFTNTKCSIYAGQDKVYTESVCLSMDVKPTTGIANGSVCLEMNTGKKFMFNEDSGEWVEVPSSGGGGGGGSSDFSTAQVTVNIIDFEDGTEIYLKDVPKVENGILMSGEMYVVTATDTITIPIAPNGVRFGSRDEPLSTTGNATVTQEGRDFIITVTGDSVINYQYIK